MRTTELPAPLLAPYTEGAASPATVAWPMRASEELRSARVFRALAQASRVVGLPDPWPARFASAVRDEVRHARLCAVVGAAARRALSRPTTRARCAPASRASPSRSRASCRC